MAITEKYASSAGSGTGDGLSAANAFSWTQFLTDINTSPAGSRYNMLGTISRTTSTDTISGSGTITSPIIIRGYASTITDGYQGRTGTGPGTLTTTNFASLTYTSTGRLTISGAFLQFETMSITTAFAGTGISNTGGGDTVFKSCVLTNSGTNAAGNTITSSGARMTFFDCDIVMSGASGGACGISAPNSVFDSCFFKITSTSCNGINTSGYSAIYGCVLYGGGTGSTGIGINVNAVSNRCFIRNNDIVNFQVAISHITADTRFHHVVGNMLTDGTTVYENTSSANGIWTAYNRVRGYTTKISNGGDWITGSQFGEIDGGSGGASTVDYVSAAPDFSLKSTSPAVNANIFAKASSGSIQRDQSGAVPGGGFFVQ